MCGMGSVGMRPQPAGWDCHPISIVRASCGSVEWLLFAEQIDVITASTRPARAIRRQNLSGRFRLIADRQASALTGRSVPFGD